ncbi:MAG TPA: hypothetical protein VM198_11785 [Longimicrobiales bacterium]|nr:hypothetical protein [Longimicrobiales bacterium]
MARARRSATARLWDRRATTLAETRRHVLLALLAFMIPLLAIGVTPAVTALLLYSLFPMVRNSYTGVRDADGAVVGLARAFGMTELQLCATCGSRSPRP